MSKTCKCLAKLEVIEHAGDFGSAVASMLVDDFTAGCPEIVNLAVEHALARMMHVQVLHADRDNIETNEKKVLDAVETAALSMAKRIPAILATILAEARAKENGNGRN